VPADAEAEVAEIGYGSTLALSDGIFAIAMTLLALDLRLPKLAASDDRWQLNSELLHALNEASPLIGVYLLSFWIVAQYWIAHRRLYAMVARTDRRLTLLNLLMLVLVAGMPFPSSVMGEHGDLPVAVILYACYLAATSLLVGAQWAYAGHAGLMRVAGTAERCRREVFDSAATAGVMLLAVPLTFSPRTPHMSGCCSASLLARAPGPAAARHRGVRSTAAHPVPQGRSS